MAEGNVTCNNCGAVFWDTEMPIDNNGIPHCPVCDSDDLEDYDEDEEEWVYDDESEADNG